MILIISMEHGLLVQCGFQEYIVHHRQQWQIMHNIYSKFQFTFSTYQTWHWRVTRLKGLKSNTECGLNPAIDTVVSTRKSKCAISNKQATISEITGLNSVSFLASICHLFCKISMNTIFPIWISKEVIGKPWWSCQCLYDGKFHFVLILSIF